MTAIDRTPTNTNFLNNLNFEFRIQKAPHVNYFLQTATIPGITLPETSYPNPFVRIPIHGDHVEYQDLTINFKIDENFKNWIEIHNWIRELGFPSNFDEFAKIDRQDKITGMGKESDVSLFISTSLSNPNLVFTFKDAFPISLSGLSFNTTSEDVMFLEAEATFKYTLYDIEYIT